MTKFLVIIFFLLTILLSNCGQTQTPKQSANNTTSASYPDDIPVGGPCDRCDIMYEGMPPLEKIKSGNFIANKKEPGDRMEINGTVFNKDGKTPAKNIILYIYHTNATGRYAPSDTQTIGRLHGHLRGWVKTNDEGKFSFSSIRPAPYPGRDIPAHIHILVKEPGKTLYYIDEVWFEDDPIITKESRSKTEKRGGDMIMHLTKNGNTWAGILNITLGLNIPGYR